MTISKRLLARGVLAGAGGATSHNAIAAKLKERNVRTARGGAWTHVQVGAILHPFGGASAVVV
jgi:hypothetical protein